MFSLHPFRGYYALGFEAYAAVTDGILDGDHPRALQRIEGPRKWKWIKRLPEFRNLITVTVGGAGEQLPRLNGPFGDRAGLKKDSTHPGPSGLLVN